MTNFTVFLVVPNSKRTGHEYVGTYRADSAESAKSAALADPYFPTLPIKSRKGELTAVPSDLVIVA